MKLNKSQKIIAAVIAAYFVGSVVQNILAVKTFEFHGVSTVAGGVLLTWMVFASGDIITEILGKSFSLKCTVLGALASLTFSGVCAIAVALPGNNSYVSECYALVFGSTWRISIASAIAYVGGGWINVQIMDRLHKRDGDRRYSLRSIVSTIAGQLFDDYVFIFLAFAPFGISAIENPWSAILVMPLFSWVVETITGTLSVLITKPIVEKLKLETVREGVG